jgi:elongation factor Ts
MVSISAEKIKNLRDKTGVSMMACREALEATAGDEEAALKWLGERGVEFAEKKSSRATKSGIVEAYIHGNGRVGVLLELKSETDFVAKNPLFKDIAHDIAMHIAASAPADVKELLSQPFIKNLDVTVGGYLAQTIQKFGENIEISRFERFEL